MQGKVKWFSDKRGYGFIECESIEKDIFFHFTEIQKPGYKILYDGDIVEFDYIEERNKADNIRLIKRACDVNTSLT